MPSAAFIWAKVLGHIENKMGAAATSAWFDDTNVVEITDHQLILSTPYEYQQDVIQRRCMEYIQDAMRELYNQEVEVVVLLEENVEEYKSRMEKPKFVEFNPEFTFEKFVVGSSNRFAHAAAVAVANNPAGAYNPLLIYGPSGLGKTHLLYAIAAEIHKQHPNYNIVYIKGDQFTNELVAALQEGRNIEFRSKYRNADLFLMDDIQFIAGKASTEEEFFHTFNTLYEAKKQIVLTSDRPPEEMLKLEDRLKTRFQWGLQADIIPPDYETRMAIIKNKATSLGLDMPDDVCAYIAENVTSNVRQIEGTVKKILAFRDLLGDEVDEDTVERAIRDMLKKQNEFVPSADTIINEICKYYLLDEGVLRGQQRVRDAVTGRQIAMYLCKQHTQAPLTAIGAAIGGKNHATVLHACKTVANLIETDKVFQQLIEEIERKVMAR